MKPKASTSQRFGAVHVRQLRRGMRAVMMGGDARDLVVAAGAAVDFLNARLTDAARTGCHHCDEGEPGTPCWWCGLRNRGR